MAAPIPVSIAAWLLENGRSRCRNHDLARRLGLVFIAIDVSPLGSLSPGSFDEPRSVPYTRLVRRSLAAVAALSLFALQCQTFAFHVHSVPARVHGQRHSHGPAIHHHDQPGSHRPALVSKPETAGDVITITVPAGASFAIAIADVEFGEVFSLHLPEMSARVFAIDVRSHSPPPIRNFLLRGPPSSNLL